MNNLKWHPFFYNRIETNIETTECGKIRRVDKPWHGKGKGGFRVKYGEIDLSKTKTNNSGYRCIRVAIKNNNTKSIFVHQIIASIFHNYIFKERLYVVDHIDSNKLNNCKDNLRLITNRENCSKEKVINSGLPVGVYWNKNEKKYRSHIRIDNNRIHLGYFKNIEDASLAYQNALSRLLQKSL